MALVAYRFPGSDSRDFAAARVLADVISDQRSPFFAGMPFDKFYNASFLIDDMPKASLGIAQAIALQPKDVPDVERAVVQNLGAATRAGFSAELVEDAKLKEISHDVFQRSSIQGLAEVWSQAVAVEGRSSPDDDIAAIRAVSADDVNRVADEYLTATTEISADLTPKPSGASGAGRRVRRHRIVFAQGGQAGSAAAVGRVHRELHRRRAVDASPRRLHAWRTVCA